MRNICIIPARSGSKGLKDKNIKDFCGKPLIAYAIEEANKTRLFDVVMVSTDSEKYARIAKEYGADVPFLRSQRTSSDEASSWDVVKEVLTLYKTTKGLYFDNVFLLQPTSPLRQEKDIVCAYDLFLEKEANYVVGVCRVDHSPLWSNTLPDDLSLNGFVNSNIFNLPRQSLEQYYRINGAIYIIRTQYLLSTPSADLLNHKAYAYVMDRAKSIDIDDEFDFEEAEYFFKRQCQF